MTIFMEYLKKRWYLIVFFNLFFGIVNGIIYTSGVDLISVDVLYLNGLLSILTIGFFIYDYYKFIKDMRDMKDMNRAFDHQVDMVEKLRDEVGEIEDYLTKWVHEVKVPISVARIIGEEIDNGHGSELIRELDRMNFLLNQLLFLNRARSSQMDMRIEAVDIKPLVIESVKAFKRLLIHKNISVDVKGEARARTDKKWISYIFNQIIHNAYKYMDDGGWLHIDIDQKPDQVIICFEDNGIGLSDQEMEQVFKRGFVGKNGRNSNQSTGFGLYLSSRVGRLMDADLKAFHGQAGGLKMKVYLPGESPNNQMKKDYHR